MKMIPIKFPGIDIYCRSIPSSKLINDAKTTEVTKSWLCPSRYVASSRLFGNTVIENRVTADYGKVENTESQLKKRRIMYDTRMTEPHE